MPGPRFERWPPTRPVDSVVGVSLVRCRWLSGLGSLIISLLLGVSVLGASTQAAASSVTAHSPSLLVVRPDRGLGTLSIGESRGEVRRRYGAGRMTAPGTRSYRINAATVWVQFGAQSRVVALQSSGSGLAIGGVVLQGRYRYWRRRLRIRGWQVGTCGRVQVAISPRRHTQVLWSRGTVAIEITSWRLAPGCGAR
jgi:hypothetical protein